MNRVETYQGWLIFCILDTMRHRYNHSSFSLRVYNVRACADRSTFECLYCNLRAEIERMSNAGSDTKSDFVVIIGKLLDWRIVQKQCY